MKDPTASLVLAAHLALLSSISFGGFPTVLPDVRSLVTANGWATDQEFANFFAISQVVPGPNMILMMSFVGLKVGGIPGAIISAFATFGPPCLMYYTSYRLWDRFRDRAWQQMVRRGLAPLTIGLVIAGGYVMARAADTSWQRALVTAVQQVFCLRLDSARYGSCWREAFWAALASLLQGSDCDRVEVGHAVGFGPQAHSACSGKRIVLGSVIACHRKGS